MSEAEATAQPAQPAYKKNIYDNPKLSLRAPNAKGKMASLQWALFANNPRITVYTNDPDDTTDNGRISANMNPPTFFALLQLLSRAIKSKEYFKAKIENKNHPKGNDGGRSENAVVVSNTVVERDNDGVISLSVVAPSRPIIKFIFGPDEYHSFVHKDGTVWTKAELSQIYAEGYLSFLTGSMTTAMNVNYVEPQKRERPAGGFQRNSSGGNRGNWNGGNRSGGGGYQRQGGYNGGNGGGGGYRGNGGGNWNKNPSQAAPEAAPKPAAESFDDWPD